MPWLQKIPVLGWLFKTESIDNKKKQLLIFITPRILTGVEYTGTKPNMGKMDEANSRRSVNK
jgi:type IV pilus assembly protein PilQ